MVMTGLSISPLLNRSTSIGLLPKTLFAQQQNVSEQGGTEISNIPKAIPNEQVDRNQWPLRQDGTKKGLGWLGVLPNAFGGVSSELTVGVSFDGKEYLIPTMVPTLDKEEINYILTVPPNPKMFKTPIGQRIIDKAVAHAKERIQTGLSPFKD